MRVRISNEISGGGRWIPGPRDLDQYGRDFKLYLHGEPTDVEKAQWAAAIGLFVMRGGEVG